MPDPSDLDCPTLCVCVVLSPQNLRARSNKDAKDTTTKNSLESESSVPSSAPLHAQADHQLATERDGSGAMSQLDDVILPTASSSSHTANSGSRHREGESVGEMGWRRMWLGPAG